MENVTKILMDAYHMVMMVNAENVLIHSLLMTDLAPYLVAIKLELKDAKFVSGHLPY
jgi:hypothetical protein